MGDRDAAGAGAGAPRPVITDAHRRQYAEQGFFILEKVIPEAHLALLRSTAASAVGTMHEQMDREQTDTLGINHRGKRYFVGQSFEKHPELGGFLFSDLMAQVCEATVGKTAFLHNDQFVIKCGQTGMSFAWHQDGAYVTKCASRLAPRASCLAPACRLPPAAVVRWRCWGRWR